MNGTPSEVWQDALYKLRNNHFKYIDMNDLLKEINKQYEHNPNFQMIYDLRKEYLKR